MARGWSIAAVEGNVGDPIVYGETRRLEPCCSFFIGVEETTSSIPTWAKINVYGKGQVDLCRARLKKGIHVGVKGNLMNRPRRTDPDAPFASEERDRPTLEIRCSEITFHD